MSPVPAIGLVFPAGCRAPRAGGGSSSARFPRARGAPDNARMETPSCPETASTPPASHPPRGGPRTEAGKRSSSGNALRHGLHARALVLPGERVELYEQLVASYSQSLQPRTLAEADLVAGVADTAWKLRRLRDIEHHRAELRLAAELEQEKLHKSIEATRAALTAVRTLASVVDERPVPPPTWAELAPFTAALKSVIALVDDVPGVDARTAALLPHALRALEHAGDGNTVDAVRFQALAPAAREAEVKLLEKLVQEEAQVPAAHERLVRVSLGLTGEDVKVLGRHRQQLEASLARQVVNYDALRAVADAVSASESDATTATRHVQLRVVKG